MRTKKGTVIAAKMQNTVTVEVTRYVVHPIYQKRYPVSKKFLADTAGHTAKIGDVVLIGETKPISKRKHFKILEVISSDPGAGALSLEAELSSTREAS